jgi:hypothetical protein
MLGDLDLGDGERLELEGVPGPAAGHFLFGEISDGVDGLFAHVGGPFMGEGVEQETLEGGEGVGREMVVQSQPRLVGLGGGGGDPEQEPAEEDEGEGAHDIELGDDGELAEGEEIELGRLGESLVDGLLGTGARVS